MAKAKDFFKKIGEKFGLSADEITKLTSNAAFDTIEIDDAVATKISNIELFTEESAASHTKIRSKLRAEVLDGVDADLKRIATKAGMTEDELTEISKLDKTSLRLEKLYEKIATAEQAKATTTGKQKTELEKEIEKLNAQVKTVRDEYEGKISSLTKDRESDKVNWELSSKFNSLDWHIPEGVDKEIILTGGKAKLEKVFREKGIIFKMTESGLMPFNQKEDTPYFENNVKISVDDLFKKHATENNLLKVSGQQKQNQHQQQNNNQFQQRQQSGNQEKVINDSGLNKLMEESLKRDFGQS